MTQCMESWLIADWKSVASYFGQGFALKHKPGGSIEEVQKAQVYATLEQASKDCKAGGGYRKGRDSFELLSRVDPQVVCSASPWAQRFIDELMVRKP